MRTNTCNYETVVLFSPYILKNNYNTSFSNKFGIKLNVDDIMIKYSTIFWDSIWYFKLNNLEYDFMLPYYYKLETIKSLIDFNIDFDYKEKDKENNDEENEPFDMNNFKITNFNFVI